MLVDIGLKFYAVSSRPTLGDHEVKVTDLEILRLSRLSGKAQLRELRWPATALIFLF